MRFNKKRIIAIFVFLLLSFFMITFGNPVENKAIVTRNVKFIDSYDDELLAEKTVELGKAVEAPTVPKHKDLVFINWYVEGTDDIANLDKILEDSTFVTRYADDKNNNGIPDDEDTYYTVRFIDGLDDTVLKTQRVLVGLNATAPAILVHEGYTFNRWDTVFTNVRRNLTVTSLFDINSYNLTINYVYAKDNSKAYDSYNNIYIYNTDYNVASPSIAGYTADKLTVNGTMVASDTTVEVKYTANKDTAYKVEHYTENLDGTYILVQTDNMVGETDTLTNAIAQLYEGFTIQAFNQENINGDGSTVVKIYYTRNSYDLKINYIYDKDQTTAATSYGATLKYEESYSEISPLIAGYTADKLVVSGTMPHYNLINVVKYTANKDTAYKVEHYTENLDGTYTLYATDNLTGETDTLTNASTKTITGFTVQSFSQENIAGDGTTVIRINYTRNVYQLVYKIDGEIYRTFDVKYDAFITPLARPSKTGYTFHGWSSIPSKMPANNVEITGGYTINRYSLIICYQYENGLPARLPYIGQVTYNSAYSVTTIPIAGYTADKLVVSGTMPASNLIVVVTYRANLNTPYKVEYYKGNTLQTTDTVTRTAKTDTLVSVTTADKNKYTGYTFDNLNFNNRLTAIVRGDGLTVLKVYYKINYYNLRYNANKPTGIVGTTSTPASRSYTVEDSFNITATMASTSHNFLGWYTNPAGTGSPVTNIAVGTTGNIDLYAKWEIKTFTINFAPGTHGSIDSTSTPNVAYNSTFGSISKPIVTTEAGYTFTGWDIDNSALLTGTVTATAQYTANTDTVYKVEHYQETLETGLYEFTPTDTDSLTGTTDTLTSAVAKTYTGFTAESFSQVNIEGDESTVVRINYKRHSNTLTYYVDGEIYNSSTKKYDETLTALTEPSKTGYTFSGWDYVPSTMPDHDVDVTGTYTINHHTLTITYKYAGSGNTAATTYTESYDYDEAYSEVSPIIAGYTASVPLVTGTMGDANVTVDVIYTANSYTAYKVEHYLQNIVGTYSLKEIDNLTGTTDTPTVAEANSYTGFTVKPFDQKNIEGDGSTVVRIEYTRNSYIVTFDSMGGSSVESIDNALYDNTITKPSDPTRLGYTFADWYQEPSIVNKWDFMTDTVKASLTLYAKWAEINYNLRFEINDTDVTNAINPSNPRTYTISDDMTFNNASSDSHSFDGWYTDQTNGDKVTGIVAGTTGDKTYYAHWSIRNYTLTFIDSDGSSIYRNVDWGKDLTNIPTITPKTGYTCSWDRTDFTNITSDNIINANCDPIEYNITYNKNDNGVTGATESNTLHTYYVTTGAYTLLDATSDSHSFDGWYTDPVNGTKVTAIAGGEIGDVVLYAHWTANEYTVDFEENGGSTVLPLTNVYYGSTISKPNDPLKTGFIFADWYKEDTLSNKWMFVTDTVTKDLTLYANWTKETYNLKFEINDAGVVNVVNPSNESTYTISDNITFNNASSDSHSFDGWYTDQTNGDKVTGIVAGTTTGDKTYYAHWSIKQFTLTVDANGGAWSGTTPQTINYGASVNIANPTRDGYIFTGWTSIGTGSNITNAGVFTMGSSDTTLTANWETRTDLTYTVYYRLENSTTDIANPKEVENKTFGVTYTETALPLTGYEQVAPTTKDVTITTGTNEIIFYYKAVAVLNASITSVSSSGISEVEYGDTITYTLTITNTGTGAGTLNAKDLTLLSEITALDGELIDTGLTATEIADRDSLLSTTGLEKTVAANGTSTLVFKVKVIGNAGDDISNQLTYTINGILSNGAIKTYNIEKTISVKEISETGVNIVLTLDISGSMGWNNKLESMKDAAQAFVDTIFPNGTTEGGTELCLVTFPANYSGGATLKGCTSTKTPAQLKNIIEHLNTGSGTPYTDAFNMISTTISNMKVRHPNNEDIVVFLSDGEPNGTPGYETIANNLKANGTTIYTIGFEVTSTAQSILEGLATSSSYYYTGTVANIESVFSNIAQEISTVSKTSINGVVAIGDSLDASKDIEFKVNGSVTEPSSVSSAITDGYLYIDTNNNYQLDVTKFSASDSITFTYYSLNN